MVEIRDRPSLRQIRLGIFGLRDQLGVRHFHRHAAIQLFVVGQIDQSKATFTEYSLDPVTPDALRMLSGRTATVRDRIPSRVHRHIVGIYVVQ